MNVTNRTSINSETYSEISTLNVFNLPVEKQDITNLEYIALEQVQEQPTTSNNSRVVRLSSSSIQSYDLENQVLTQKDTASGRYNNIARYTCAISICVAVILLVIILVVTSDSFS